MHGFPSSPGPLDGTVALGTRPSLRLSNPYLPFVLPFLQSSDFMH